MRFYLAEPMDAGASYKGGPGDTIQQHMAFCGASAFRPRTHWAITNNDGSLIRDVEGRMADKIAFNFSQLLEADAVVAVLPYWISSVGVPVEIYLARQQHRIPVLVYRPGIVPQSELLMAWGAEQTSSMSRVQEWITELCLTYEPVLDSAPSGLVMWAKDLGSKTDFGSRPYADDAGYDLSVAEDVIVNRGESADVRTGVAVALPHGTFGWITGRSSTWTKHGLVVVPGVIDEGWRGELRVLVHWPLNGTPIGHAQQVVKKIPAGTRIAQLIVLPNLAPDIQLAWVTDELPPGSRGEQGFGSTG